ncbi:ABC transporter ATP-binding protein [Fundicoccus culcitae]|uniref:ABC transporter ATP-binding protein n=1 Tax=Fundicoccus culcitae TaxID=2969821 RepID=A0ABY5P4F3_9LACT|nr:ABC transporter ATP-binding protein [Fundicoccus culcitae]UUX33365.1 ABC transporter ATP-binding protein [Fundicoccus culcitae]
MIEIKNLEIKYDDFVAIDDISLTIEEGEFFTLLGPSGCGKTTTLRSIAGFITPTKGEILIGDKNIIPIPVEQRGIGMVFQSYALFPTMTVYDNIAYGLKVDKLSKRDIDQRVHELAELVELNQNQLSKNVSALSGGQQQRVAIARSLAKNPKIVLFDEPLSNLDAKLRKQLRSELKRIQKETGMTAIYVTHDQEEALELSDHIAVFNNGKIDQIGTPEEIYNQSKTEFVCNFIGEANLIGKELMGQINEQLNHRQFDLTKKHYIREEKIRLWHPENNQEIITLTANVEDVQFYGKFLSYNLQLLDTKFKTIEKQDGSRPMVEMDELEIFIDPNDILAYEEGD